MGRDDLPRQLLHRGRDALPQLGEALAQVFALAEEPAQTLAQLVVAITKGKLDFGPWEQIFYGEFDGRRAKRVLVKVIGE